MKLLVSKGDGTKTTSNVGTYRQVEPINFAPTYYPAVPPASEPLPPSTGPAADPCGGAQLRRAVVLRQPPSNGPVQGAPAQDGYGQRHGAGHAGAHAQRSRRRSVQFQPGVAGNYNASTMADAVSTAGNAALSWSGPNHLTNGAFTMPQPFTVDFSKAGLDVHPYRMTR